METVSSAIIRIVQGYDGQKEILPYNNSGFQDPAFQAKLAAIGWEAPDPWCAAAAIAAWTEALSPHPILYSIAKKLFSLNSQQMFRNFHNDPVWPTSQTEIVTGAMAIYADGDSSTSGHTTVVLWPIGTNQFRTEEGNTIPEGNPGNEREGYIEAQHTHTLGLPHSQSGLNFIGFILPVEPFSDVATKLIAAHS